MNSFIFAMVLFGAGITMVLSSVYATKHSHYGHDGGNNGGAGWGNGGGGGAGWGSGGRDLQREESNKRVVLAFYQEVLGDKNVDAADKYVSSKQYIQHNPLVPDGLEAMKVVMKEWFQGAPKTKTDVHHLSAEGDLVWIHVREVDSATGNVTSIMDIFKLKNGKIIEHWDVSQQVPEKSANSHPMF